MKLEVRSGVVEAFDGLTLQRLDLSYALSLGLKGYSGSMAEVLLQDAMGGHRVVLMMILEKTIMILAPQSKVALQLSPRRSSQRGCACLGYWLLTPSTLRARVGVPLAVNVELSWCLLVGARHICCGDGADSWTRHPAVGWHKTTACFLRDAGDELIHNTSKTTRSFFLMKVFTKGGRVV